MIKKDCDDWNVLQWCSSIVNDGIGKLLYLLRKDPISTKSTKSDSLHRCF